MKYQPAEIIVGEDVLEEMLKEWQTRLGVDHWNITIRKGNLTECGTAGDEPTGCILISSFLQAAQIIIVNENQFLNHSGVPFDMELAIVHELLHLHVPNIEDLHKLETCVWSIAKTLITLKREKEDNQ